MMGQTKRIVCLANSRKYSGRCVAGVEVVQGKSGAWIRPVSSRPNEQLHADECSYEDGVEVRVLDIIDVPLGLHRPHGHQTENWLTAPSKKWTKYGRCPV